MNWCQARPRDSVFGRARQEARTKLLMAGPPGCLFAPLCGAGAGPPSLPSSMPSGPRVSDLRAVRQETSVVTPGHFVFMKSLPTERISRLTTLCHL
jgi:hypothetical protein